VTAAAAEQPPQDATQRCANCGAAADGGQLVCLECGARIALVYRRPPSWKVPIAITVVIVALVAALAAATYTAIDDNAKREVNSAPPRPKPTSQVPMVGQYLASRSPAAATNGPSSTPGGVSPSSSACIVSTADAARASTS